MARKSRKITAAAEPVIEVQPTETFPTAIYARLSVENSGKSEKVDVIANQIEICKSYIADRPYLDLIDTYIDNGHTGTVFDRPEFNRLINDIKTGRIKCLVVRDLSRFGRDYIETGTYLERIFPQIGLRFIAIKENYDSFDTDGSSESLMIPLQNMINALYSKDISRKVSTALKAQMEDGTFVKRNLPYGYKWDEEHSNMVIDEEAAQYVRLIFRWKLEGKSNVYILDTLESMGAPTPEYQKRVNGTRKGDGYSRNGWNRSTLPEILTNPHYVGDTVLGRSLRALYKGVRPHKIKDKDQWIVFPNTHEAIISREDFEKVQDRQKWRNPKRYALRSSISLRAKSSVRTAAGRCTSTKSGSTRTSAGAGMRSMNAALRFPDGISTAPRTTPDRTRLKQMSSQRSSFKSRRLWIMTDCWTSSEAARVRKTSGKS